MQIKVRDISKAPRLVTHHFTLAQRHPVMIISSMKCMLPRDRTKRPRKMSSSVANTQSTIVRNTGLREEPGVRMLERKSPEAPSCEPSELLV